jgi:hypothetical protein
VAACNTQSCSYAASVRQRPVFRTKARSILIVEDNDDARQMLKVMQLIEIKADTSKNGDERS